jgi:hypothetical protein
MGFGEVRNRNVVERVIIAGMRACAVMLVGVATAVRWYQGRRSDALR